MQENRFRLSDDKVRSKPRQGTRHWTGSEGFTLVELLVVLSILVMIAIVAVPETIKYLDRAKTDSARVAVQNIGGALDLFRLDVGRYPTAEEGLDVLVDSSAAVPGWNGPYLRKKAMLIDPWDRPYRYQFPGQNGAFDLFTYGADDAEGGEGENEDIGNW